MKGRQDPAIAGKGPPHSTAAVEEIPLGHVR
jgi:hypothetical protein